MTWHLCSDDDSTIVDLSADELARSPGSDDDLELIWLRILSAPVKCLDGPATTEVAR
jgi:hypothetical protein